MDDTKRLIAERGRSYGPPEENHGRTARLWNAYLLGRQNALGVSRVDVCFMNILQKIARCQSEAGPTKDSLEDIKGYAENVSMIMTND